VPQRQGPTTTITIMAAAGKIGPLQPPMRAFIPHQCVWSTKDDPLSNLISFLWGLEECLTRLPIPVFRNPYFGPQKSIPARISEDYFFRGISSQERGFGGVLKIPVFSCFHRIFSQEFLWDRYSCICTGFFRIPPDSSGFLFLPKAVWFRPATKEGSL